MFNIYFKSSQKVNFAICSCFSIALATATLQGISLSVSLSRCYLSTECDSIAFVIWISPDLNVNALITKNRTANCMLKQLVYANGAIFTFFLWFP